MDTIEAALAKFEEPNSKPLNYIRKSASKCSNTQDLLGDVFKLMVSRFEKGNPNKNQLLKEIFIQNFESEQIWQQLELRNKILKSYVPRITKLLLSQSTVKFPYYKKSDLPESLELDNSKDDALTEENDESSSDESAGEDNENEISGKSENNENMNNEEEDGDDEEEYNSEQRDETSKTNRGDSGHTGDMFFDLNEMESFLEKAENEDPNGGDDGIDYFTDILSSDEEDGEQPMYKDFFKDPTSKKNLNQEEENEDSNLSDENDEEEDEASHFKKQSKRKNVNSDEANGSKKVRFMSDNDESDSDESEIDQKSSFEKKNSKLKEQIAKLEENALSEKPWPQRGEVDAQQRPVNSLLEEIVDVDLTTRPAPIMTEKVTLDLESIILKRIKDKAFDDVEKKIKPVHVQHELKKELVLNQEKSKFSLAQVYEQEYLSKQEANNEQETIENKEMTEQKEEILKMMKSVFKKLDTLSNFHYTPKPVTEELKIISNAPAISLEEAIPMAVAESNTLAPQEISGSKKKTLIGKDERTKTDKRRERRKKKAFLSNKFKKSKNAADPATKVLKSKNVSLAESSDKDKKTVSTSTKFFTKLQENSEAGALIKKPKGKPSKPKPHK